MTTLHVLKMKEVTKKITYSSRRGQELILVLAALWELGARNSKRETIFFINSSGWFDVSRHDLPAYVGCNEPKYHTLLAWARKDGTIKEWIFDEERDSWGITRDGRRILEKSKENFQKEWKVSECYLWTPKFKKIMDASYVPSDADRKHPEDELEDLINSL
jgi:hypothetical protein